MMLASTQGRAGRSVDY